MFCPFAANSSCVAASRTWPMLPGADWNFSENTVWTESTMMKRRPQPGDLLEDPLEAGLGEEIERRLPSSRRRVTPSRSPRDLIWCSDSSPEL